MSDTTQNFDITNPQATLPPVVDFGASTQSPDFETLLEGALTFDFGLLDHATSH
jgi:hypothetical protein